jgi:hypothetical protein
MFTNNPFAEISASMSPSVMQVYVLVMFVLVVAGTVYDVLHKRSARYFFNNWRDAKKKGTRKVGGGEMVSLAVKTAVVDVMASGEFCSMRRRIAHLLTMYGFVAFVITTTIMVFQFPTAATPAPVFVAQLWHFGAFMVCLGGYWFWFFIRVDVAAEGNSPFRIVRADLFVLSLLASTTFALIWSYLQNTGSPLAMIFFGLHIIATTILFGSVPWSKFAHMFFKPAAALERRVAEANGSRSNLPAPADRPDNLGSSEGRPRNY